VTRRRRWYKLRRADLLLIVGVVGFLSQLARPVADPTMVYGSLTLMGLPLLARLDDKCKHVPEDDEDEEDR